MINIWNQILNLLFCKHSICNFTEGKTEICDEIELNDFSVPEPMKVRISVMKIQPLTSLHEGNELVIALENILAKQDADAERRIQQSWCYLHTGYQIQKAAFHARDAVISALDDALRFNSLDPILLAVAQCKADFLEYHDDDEAFASATFNEILSDLLRLQSERGEEATYSYEHLSSLR